MPNYSMTTRLANGSYSAPRTPPKRSRPASRRTARPSKVPRKFVSIGRQTLPPILKNTVIYGETQFISLTATTSYVWSCNGLFDPNITGTGHQPRGFDELCGLYNHYTVTASRIKFWTASGDTRNIVASIIIDDDGGATGTNTFDAMVENSVAFRSYTPSVSEQKPLYAKWSSQNVFGANGIINPSLQGTSSTNPSEQSYFVCTVRDLTGVTPLSINLCARIEYDVIWSERLTLSAS